MLTIYEKRQMLIHDQLLEAKVKVKIKNQLQDIGIIITPSDLIANEFLSSYFVNNYLIINKKSLFKNKMCDKEYLHIDRNQLLSKFINQYKLELKDYLSTFNIESFNYMATSNHDLEHYFYKFYEYLNTYINIFYESKEMIILKFDQVPTLINMNDPVNLLGIEKFIYEENEKLKNLGSSIFYDISKFYKVNDIIYYLGFEYFSTVPILFYNAMNTKDLTIYSFSNKDTIRTLMEYNNYELVIGSFINL